MLLAFYEKKWTFCMCSLYFFWNMVAVNSSSANKQKDLYFVSDDKVFQKNYRFEDFFWTGSGDGPLTEELFNNYTDTDRSLVQPSPLETWRTTTVFHTTTILFATVYSNSDGCIENGCKPHVYTVQTASTDFSLPTIQPSETFNILPSPTQEVTKTFITYVPEVQYPSKGLDGGVITSKQTPISVTPSTYPDNGINQPGLSKTNWSSVNISSTTVFPDVSLDQKYWVLTVLRNDDYSPKFEINSTENKLSSLYKKAFNRRQDKFLGGTDFRRDRKIIQPVNVHIVNVTRQGNDLEVLYIVTISGAPVPAMTAANDMRLLTTSEVIAELGYPILTKAEPYIKNVVPLGARIKGRTRDTWLFIGSVIAAVLLLIILAGLFALGLSKNRTKRSTAKGLSNKKQVFEEEEGSSNLAFEAESDLKAKSVGDSTHRSQLKSKDSKFGETSGTTVKFTEEERRGSSTSSSCSGSSEASLVRLRYQQKRREKWKEEKEEKPKPKPRTRIRRIESSDCSKNYRKHGGGQSASSAISKNTFDEITTEGYDELDYSPRLMKSPTSYLSMPSVRAFPRGTKIPEPLNKILEPTSIRHLDADSDSQNEHHRFKERTVEVDIEQVCEMKNKFQKRKALTRHASLEGDDPGFIGPVVWNRHCQKISEGETVTFHEEDFDETVNVGRMRRRFNELLDDALSMFGSRNGSPEGSDDVPVRQPDNRVHSAVVRPAVLTIEESAACRPKTTGSKRPQSSVILGPRGAWETPSSSTLTRPISAGVFRKSSPTIDKSLIYVNSELPPSDPAVPLIAAIKNELKKFDDPSHSNM